MSRDPESDEPVDETENEVEEDEEEDEDFEDDEDDDIRMLVDEEGNEHPCILLAVLDHEGKEYAMLVPEDQYNDESDEMEVYVFEYKLDGDEEAFIEIADQDVYAQVIAVCEKILAEQMDGEGVEYQKDEDDA